MVAVAVAALSACFRPTYDEPACGPNAACPAGLRCDRDNICRGELASDAAPDGDLVDGDDGDATSEVDAAGSDGSATDAPPGVEDIVHVRAIDEVIGTGDLTIATAVTITTSGTPASNLTLPTGVSLAVVPQDGGGSDLVVLRVRTLSISGPGSLRATGTRPLVILAETATIGGWVDVAASGATPGAGAAVSGGGVGGNGTHEGNFADGGGGGASFGGDGADGGDASCNTGCGPSQTAQGGARGDRYGTAPLTTLEGGSPGGRSYFPTASTSCPMGNPGAGGGAIQIYARTAITIAAGSGIAAGGGGGAGGDRCDTPFNWLAGHGGGSGGAIYLQAPIIQSAGLLLANGGGGGGGAGQDGDGGNGDNAGRTTATARGGTGSGAYGAEGGDGATDVGPADRGGDGPDEGNGGGGGGGVGRIHVRSRTAPTLGQTSPPPAISTY